MLGLGVGVPVVRRRGGWLPFAGAVVDMDFKAGKYFGTNAAALVASTGSIKITGAGLQVVTGDLITTADATLLAALNSATTVVRARVNIPSVPTAGGNGFINAKTGAFSTLVVRLRSNPNQTSIAASHGTGLANLSAFASTQAGVAVDNVAFTVASRHRTTAVSVSANGVFPNTVSPAGKGAAIDTVQFGVSEAVAGSVILNGYIERLTIWTDDPTDTVLRARAV